MSTHLGMGEGQKMFKKNFPFANDSLKSRPEVEQVLHSQLQKFQWLN